MTLTRTSVLAPKADIRARPENGETWLRLDDMLWLSPGGEVARMVTDPSGDSTRLSYDFAAARLDPPGLAQLHPEAATDLLAESLVLLQAKLASVAVDPLAPIGYGGSFPSLFWGQRALPSNPAALRVVQRGRSQALKSFLAAAHALDGSTEDAFSSAVLKGAEALKLPARASLQVEADFSRDAVSLVFSMEDPGKALPDVGHFVTADEGHRFVLRQDRPLDDLRADYARALAGQLAALAHGATGHRVLHLVVTVRVADNAFTLRSAAEPG